jgi:hypothetical protein
VLTDGTVWLDDPTHTYHHRDGRLLPGVTQILKAGGFIREETYRFARRFGTLDAAMERGRFAHLAIHLLEKGTLDWFSLDADIEQYVHSYERWKNLTAYRVLHSEGLVWEPTYQYAGSFDSWGVLNGEEVLIDFKTGAIPWWGGLQLAAYNFCLPTPTLGPQRKRYGLQLFDDGAAARLKAFDDIEDEAVFLGAVGGFHYKVKKRQLAVGAAAPMEA